MRSFENRVCVITGAANGIGLALAIAASNRHMKLVLSDVNEEALNAVVKGPLKHYTQVKLLPLDVTEKSSVKRLKDFAYRSYGAVHVVFLNPASGLPEGNLITGIVIEVDWPH
jgi:short-subunit dehydrogenase